MKVSGSRPTGTTGVGRVKKKGAAGAGFSVDEAEAASGAAQTQAPAAVSGVGALLAMQEVDADGKGARRRAVQRGHDMLDLLDDIQICLLEGGLPEAKLKALLRVVNADDNASPDPDVNAVLDEVELRARVELAKFGHYG